VPEITVRQVGRDDKFIIIASDGVFEFLTNQHTIDIIKEYEVRS
jgi:serine/threonine protein phosphatase PrpC